MIKPRLEDFPEFYRRYIEEVIDRDIRSYLEEQKFHTVKFFAEIGEEKSNHRYAEGKWSIKEILGHICDGERIFATRALQFARNEKQELPGFEEDDYVAAANFSELPLNQLIEDFNMMRDSHISLFNTFNEDMLNRRGIANKTEYTVNSIFYMMAGHIDHHVKVINERYL